MYRVYGEKCCGQKSPFGLTEKVPVFSWRLESDGYGVYQEAFELTVWDQDGKIMWKSGLQKGKNVHNIPYAGEALSSLTYYLWQVRSFGNSKEKASGDILRFTTGIMDTSEWKASWIEADYERRPCDDDTESWKLFAGKMPYLEKPEEKLNPCLYFRREVHLNKRVVRAMASATAHVIPDMMSGRYVSAGLSSCGWADACVIVPYGMYQVYADQKILKDNYAFGAVSL